MTLMNVMALIDKIAFGVDDGLSDDESNKLEFGKEFGLMIYKPAGRFAMIKHFIQLGKAASKEFVSKGLVIGWMSIGKKNGFRGKVAPPFFVGNNLVDYKGNHALTGVGHLLGSQ